ncbi:MAG: hypothetical protein ACKO4Y_03425 [Flavobacteriales bacterium]
MKTLNRAYLSVLPTEEFWEAVTPMVEDQDFIAFHESTIYLIDEDIWDEETVIDKYMKKIAINEFNQLVDDTKIPFDITNISDFKRFFTVTIGGSVVDCISTPPERN